MDKLKELIEKMLSEGKELPEIAKAVMELKQEDAKEGDPEIDDEKTVIEVEKIIKSLEVEKIAKKRIEKKAVDSELKKSVDQIVEDKLKSMPAIKEVKEEQKEIKFFNFATKKFQVSKGLSEGKQAFIDLLVATNLASKNDANAKAISKDIEADWSQNAARMGMPGMKTLLRSDATTGSYLIPTEIAIEILEVAYAQSVMMRLCNNQAVIYNDKVFPIIYDGDFAWLADETATIADKTPVISNPSVVVKRFGGIYLASNTLLQMKGEALVSAFVSQAASKVNEFLDLYVVAASIDGSGSDPLDGILFNSLTSFIADVAVADYSYDNIISGLINDIDSKISTADMTFLANRKMRRKTGLLQDASGRPLFDRFVSTGNFAPEGISFVENTRIPSTFDIATEEPLTGSNDVVILGDFSKVLLAVDNLRIDTSEHYKFAQDQMAWRFIGRVGTGIISGSGTAGKVVSAVEIDNS
ncbi:MAG: phage major capsid protein [bacterium]|nr:phage major capsid protein [bacterium]